MWGEIEVDSFLPDKTLEASQRHCPLSEPSSIQSHSTAAWVAPPWQLPKALPHPIYQWAFLQQAMLLRQGVKAALPNTQKQTQGGCQDEDTKKYGPNKRTDLNSRKTTKLNGDK